MSTFLAPLKPHFVVCILPVEKFSWDTLLFKQQGMLVFQVTAFSGETIIRGKNQNPSWWFSIIKKNASHPPTPRECRIYRSCFWGKSLGCYLLCIFLLEMLICVKLTSQIPVWYYFIYRSAFYIKIIGKMFALKEHSKKELLKRNQWKWC